MAFIDHAGNEQKVDGEEVLKALSTLEDKIFGRICTNQQVPERLRDIFTQLYIRNWYPQESVILIKSYLLLQSKGYYHN